MERRRKPTVIKLREHLQDTTILNAGDEKVESSLPLCQSSQNCAAPERMTMVSQLDEELRNDFKWLVGFDLKTVFLHDIEQGNSVFDSNREVTGSIRCEKICKSTLKRKGKINRRAIKHEMKQNLKLKKNLRSNTYFEMVIQCLHEIGEATVKNIYNWISDTFPDFKPSDMSWKNVIRHTLTVNSDFQKKKSPCGRCHIWYLNRASANRAENDIFHNFSSENLIKKESQNSRKLKFDKKNSSKNKSVGLNEENINTDCYLISVTNGYNENNYQQMYDAENWIVINSETNDERNCNQEIDQTNVSKTMPEEYYIQGIPINEFSIESTSYTEPMEVKYLLDENAASIPVQIIEGKSF